MHLYFSSFPPDIYWIFELEMFTNDFTHWTQTKYIKHLCNMQSLYFCLVSVYFCILHTSWFSQVNNLNTLMNMYLFNWIEINQSIYHRVNSWYWYCYRLKVLNDVNIIQSNDGIVKARFWSVFMWVYNLFSPFAPILHDDNNWPVIR